MDELKHHGILGMKWGIRRYQNKDGSLTSGGKKRYNVDIESAKNQVEKSKKRYKEAKNIYDTTLDLTGKNYKKLSKYEGAYLWSKEKLKNEKIKKKLNERIKDKSKRESDFEKKYMESGMSKEEAEIAAYKRIRTERILAATAAIGVTALVAYSAYKYHDKNIDKIIKSGTEIQNISVNSNKGVKDAFYFSMTRGDNSKYRGIYGNQLKTFGSDVYETKFKALTDLKVASDKSATKVLSELVSQDKDYASKLEEHLSKSVGRYAAPKQTKAIEKGLKDLKNGKVTSKVYEALNLSLTDHHLSTSEDISKGFYNKLKDKGYDVISDVNDKKFSGYNSKKPMIAFNGEQKIAFDRSRKLGEDEINRTNKLEIGKLTANYLAVESGKAALLYGGLKAAKNYLNNKSRDKIVEKFRKENPNSDLSYNEILDKYYKN